MVTKLDVFHMLENLNIKHSDKIIIHSSLRAIGEIENGADGLIDAFCEYLTDGLLIIPTHTWDEVTKENPYYDVKTSVPCIGILPKIAAFRKDAVRSLHPTHSIAVFGKNAKTFVKGEERCASPAPVGSCLSRLYEENGKILLIGVGLNRNTYLHAVDERLNIPNRLIKDGFIINIKDEEGNVLQSPPFHHHFTEGIDRCCSEYYPNFKKVFEEHGAMWYSKLGNAVVACCDARKMTDLLEKIWAKAEYDLCSREEEVIYPAL